MSYLNFVRGLLCTLLISSATQAVSVRTVALTGQHVPGAPDGVNFRSFSSSPVLNDAGKTAFWGFSSNGNDYVANGIWSEGSGSLELVARQGNQAPGTPSGVNYSSFPAAYNNENIGLVLNDAGQTGFLAGLTGSNVDPTNDQGIWSEGSGALALAARKGDQAPGAPNGVNYNGFSGISLSFPRPPALNNAGHSAFRATLTNGGGDSIWSDRSGNVAPIARTGDQVPGMPNGVSFSALNSPALNDASQMAFFATLTGSGVDFTNDESIWSEGSGSLSLLAREGSQAPGTPSGVNFGRFSVISSFGPTLNNVGQTAFHARLTGSGVEPLLNDVGIWSEGSGSLVLVARSGSQVPGMPDGVKFTTSIGSEVALNDAGQSAFKASLTGPGVDATNAEAFWLDDSGNLTLVARRGDHAPGTPSGMNFNSFYAFCTLNNAGQVAFYGTAIGNGVIFDGFWATDRKGELQLIAREGDQLEVAPGDFRTIRSLLPEYSPSGNSDGRPSQFNDSGQFVFKALFSDGTGGVFVSNRVAIPEPSTLLLLCVGSLAALWRKRAR